MAQKKALITGITGQDGSYLADLLVAKGYEVHGVVRPASGARPASSLRHLAKVRDQLKLHTSTLEGRDAVAAVVSEAKPDEVYHLAASTFVPSGFAAESDMLTQNFTLTHDVLASVKEHAPQARVFYAGSAEMFGEVTVSPQTEDMAFNPRSVYGIAKTASHHLVRLYRAQHGMFVCTAILYNHESPRRGLQFLPRKITRAAARIKLGLEKTVTLGNLDAQRDWGYAPDYAAAMQLMLTAPTARDYVVATGELRTVRQFAEKAFAVVGLRFDDHFVFNKDFYRPAEAIPLCGNPSRIERDLGWRRTKTLDQIIEEMVAADLEESRVEARS